MSVIEIASAVALVIGSLTVFCTKVIHQLENNRISFCSCMGSQCRRDTDAVLNVDIVPTEDIEKRLEATTPEPKFIQKNNVWIKAKNEKPPETPFLT